MSIEKTRAQPEIRLDENLTPYEYKPAQAPVMKPSHQATISEIDAYLQTNSYSMALAKRMSEYNQRKLPQNPISFSPDQLEYLK